MNPLLRAMGSIHGSAVFARRVRAIADAIDLLLPQDCETLLDVGCGDGSIGSALVSRRRSLRYEGVEIRPRPECSVPARGFDGRNLPYADRSVDHVLFVDVLHHAADPLALLREAKRVSRRGVLVKDHLRDRPLAGPTLALMDWIGNRPHGVSMTYRYWSSAEWEDALGRVGLRVVRRVTRLNLYPAPLRPAFEWGLHHLSLLGPE